MSTGSSMDMPDGTIQHPMVFIHHRIARRPYPFQDCVEREARQSQHNPRDARA